MCKLEYACIQCALLQIYYHHSICVLYVHWQIFITAYTLYGVTDETEHHQTIVLCVLKCTLGFFFNFPILKAQVFFVRQVRQQIIRSCQSKLGRQQLFLRKQAELL